MPCEKEFQYSWETGKCYQKITVGLTWSQARQECKKMAPHDAADAELMSAHSVEELKGLRDLIWIGDWSYLWFAGKYYPRMVTQHTVCFHMGALNVFTI